MWVWGFIEHLPGPYIVTAAFVAVVAGITIWRQVAAKQLSAPHTDHVAYQLPRGIPNLKPGVTFDECAAMKVIGKTVPIYLLPRVNFAIQGWLFEGCDIIGPAILGVCQNNTFARCSFAGFVKNLLYPVAQDRVATGCIGIISCTFISCRFIDVGFAGPQKTLQVFRDHSEGNMPGQNPHLAPPTFPGGG